MDEQIQLEQAKEIFAQMEFAVTGADIMAIILAAFCQEHEQMFGRTSEKKMKHFQKWIDDNFIEIIMCITKPEQDDGEQHIDN